jgi:hypothetical protein
MAFASAILWLFCAAPRGYEGPGAVEFPDQPEPLAVAEPIAMAEPLAMAEPGPAPRERSVVGASEIPPRTRALAARTWVVGAFVDAGYVFNSNRPDNHVNRGIVTSPRSGEFTVPYAAAYLLHAPSAREPWQLELAAQFGPAATALVAADPQPGGDASRYAGATVWQHIARANVGARIPRAGTEIAVGVFNTPLGLWSFWTKDNWNYSTPWHLNAVPYVLMGGRVLQPIGKHVVLHAWVVNGAQTYADANEVPSYMGGGIVTPIPGLQIAQFVYFGPEDLDAKPRAWRMLSDSWVSYDAGRWGLAVIFDVMRERLTLFPDAPVALYVTGAVVPRVRVLKAWRDRVQWFLTARGEVFWDRDGRSYGVKQLLGSGVLTSDVRLWDYLLLRLEYRYDQSDNRAGFFYRGAAVHDDDDGLARRQHTVNVMLTGMFEHWFATRRNR